jgi:16S rRNA U516 pseudouridylate synthase RsuA-like enzyme
MSLKHAHPCIAQRVKEVYTCNKKKGYSSEKKVIVLQKPSGVPGDQKDTAGYDNAEDFCEAVKEKITVEAGKIETSQKQ